MRSDWKCVEISTKSSQSALADLCWKQGLSRNFLHYEHVCIHAGVCVCVEIFLLSSRPPHFYKAHCRQYSSGTTASLELQAPGKPCADGLGLGMPPPPPRKGISFALHSMASLVFFRMWSVDHLHQDHHLGFSFPAHSWVHALDLPNKKRCGQGLGLCCNRVRMDLRALKV